MSKNPPPPSNAPRPSDRNEYIPDFIQKKPFFAADLLNDSDYLEHQRSKAGPRDTIAESKWYSRTKSGPAATKYRKGACENCGAMTHKAKDCLSRPRKQGAKWTGRDIQADEKMENVELGWDAKRDRWNGYDAREYDGIVRSFEEMESLRKGIGDGSQASQPHEAEGSGDAGESDAKYAEETDMGRSQPTSTRQLRLREDTAKYLVNLDLDSAKYDPKTRSMDTTTQDLNASDPSVDIASEGFVRPVDDAAAFEKAQKYAWEAQETSAADSAAATAASNMSGGSSANANAKLHLEANPTASALNIRQAEASSQAARAAKKSALLSAYGDQSTYTSNTSHPSISASERFVEYDEKGLIKGQKKDVKKSKYPEDVLTNNHTAVWGSWWKEGSWGYACCWSLVKNSYCTGEEGRKAFADEEAQKQGLSLLIESKEEDVEATGEKRRLDSSEDQQIRSKRARTEDES